MSALILLIDLPARVVVFVVLHGLIYFFSADWFGSFGGDHWLALRVVGPTLARSALFENLSGVYLYATLVGALPVYAEVVDGSLARGGADRWWLRPLRALPRGWAAALLALGLFAVFVLLLTAVAAGIADLEPL